MSKTHLVEHFYRDWPEAGVPETKLELKEASHFLEYDGKRYETRGAILVPIWRLDQKNLNGRIYTADLGRLVVEQNLVTVCLADHPKEDGSVRDIMAVAKNPRISGGILWAECYFVDEEFAKKVYKIVELGSAVGVSSSAFGDVDAQGRVMASGFELERYFDFVLNPSYQVYIDKNVVSGATARDAVAGEEEVSVELGEGAKAAGNSLKEGTLALRQKNVESRVRRMFEEASDAKGISERISRYKGILEYCESAKDVDTEAYVEEVEAALEAIEAEANAAEAKFEDAVDVAADLGKQALEQEAEIACMQQENEALGAGLAAAMNEGVRHEQSVQKLMKKLKFSERFLDDAKIRENRYRSMVSSLKEDLAASVAQAEFNELKAFAESVIEENKVLKEAAAKVKLELREMEGLLKKSIAQNRNLKERLLYDADENPVEEDIMVEEDGDVSDAGDFEPIKMEGVRFSSRQVEAWFHDKKKTTPGMSKIREDLARCRNMREAYKVFYAQEDLLEEKVMRRMESPTRSPMPSQLPRLAEESQQIMNTSIKSVTARNGWV